MHTLAPIFPDCASWGWQPDAYIKESTIAVVFTLAATPTVWATNFGELTSIGDGSRIPTLMWHRIRDAEP